MSLVTTLPAPMTTLFPMCTPPSTTALQAIQTLLPMWISSAYSAMVVRPSASMPIRSWAGSGWVVAISDTFGPKQTLLPINTRASSIMVSPKLAKKFSPIKVWLP